MYPTPYKSTARTPLLGHTAKSGSPNRYSNEKIQYSSEKIPCSSEKSSPTRCFSLFIALLMFSLSMMSIMKLSGVGPWAVSPVPVIRRVAVIGAGASGSSAAYHLALFGPGSSAIDSLEITVFERSNQVGGRCMTVDVPTIGLGSFRVELGPPGYNIALDHLLSSIVRDVGMDKDSIAGGRWAPVDTDYELGFYDGQSFLFRQPHNPGGLWYWWTSLLYFLRYGWAHRNLRSVSEKLMPMWSKATEALSLPNIGIRSIFPPFLQTSMGTLASSFFQTNNIRDPFPNEQVQSRARVRYGANLGVLSAMQALRVMEESEREAATNVVIQGGISRVFSQMLHPPLHARNAKIDLKLSTTAWGLLKNQSDDGKKLEWLVAHSDSAGNRLDPELTTSSFDEVIIASPWALTGLKTQPEYHPPATSWEKLSVTVFTTPGRLAPGPFGLGHDDHRGMPQRVMSTLSQSELGNLAGYSGVNGVGRTGWWTVEHVGTITRAVPEQEGIPCIGHSSCEASVRTENVYKILSPAKISDEKILSMLTNPQITWVHRQFWEHALVTPLPSMLSEGEMNIELDDGLWYTAGIEGVWGGLESAVTVGKRVAEELRVKWAGRRIMRGTVMLGQRA